MIDTVEIDERINKCERILKDNPHSQIFAALADAHRKKGELDAAFRVCRQGLRLHPDYGPGRLVMAKVNFDRKMYDWAEAELNEAIKLDGRTRATDLLEVEILIRRGFFSKAKVVLDRIRVADPGNEYFASLMKQIEDGVAQKKAKLAETEEFYRTSMRSERAEDFREDHETADDEAPVNFESALIQVSKLSKVEATFYSNLDGMVGDSLAPDNWDLEKHAASLTEICRFVASSIETVQMGTWCDILIESETRTSVLTLLKDRILVVLCNKDVNLGSLKLRLNKIVENLRED